MTRKVIAISEQKIVATLKEAGLLPPLAAVPKMFYDMILDRMCFIIETEEYETEEVEVIDHG